MEVPIGIYTSDMCNKSIVLIAQQLRHICN